jgi:hypothetical protein
MAAVHCVIIGFAPSAPRTGIIYEYESIDGEPHAVSAANINAYLVDGPDVFLPNRSTPICAVPAMRFGSMPRDGGHLILSPQERADLVASEPQVAPYVLRYTGAEEFLNAGERYRLWLVDAPPHLIAGCPNVRRRLEGVRRFRLASKAESTRKFAATPGLFCQIAQPHSDYLLVPRVSSERRAFVPVGFTSRQVVGNDQVLLVPGAKLYHFGIASSTMHNAWIRYTCGRLKSDFRYSKDIVYNNFPWPESPTDMQRAVIEAAAQGVLDARAQFPGASLADLYDPLTMPPALVKAHQMLDAAVDAAYGRKGFKNDAERVAFLFELYQKYTSLLPSATPSPKGRRHLGRNAD